MEFRGKKARSKKEEGQEDAAPQDEPIRPAKGLFGRLPKDYTSGRDVGGHLMQSAQIGPRCLAGGIDSVLAILFFILSVYAYALMRGYGTDMSLLLREMRNPALAGSIGIYGYGSIMLLLCWLYVPLCQASQNGVTLGMYLLKLRLAREDYSPVSLDDILWRHFLLTSLTLSGVGGVINLYCMYRAPYARGLHDQATDSFLFHER